MSITTPLTAVTVHTIILDLPCARLAFCHLKSGERADVQSTGLTAAAWFLTTTSPLPADGRVASLTSSGLALASTMYAALFDILYEWIN
jgi:hypothetical protein